jgi:hypothetical protein
MHPLGGWGQRHGTASFDVGEYLGLYVDEFTNTLLPVL